MQGGRGRRARSGVERGVRADVLDVLRRPLVDDLLQEVRRERLPSIGGRSNASVHLCSHAPQK